MHLIVHTSEYTGSDEQRDLDVAAIIATARLKNTRAGITGALFVHGRRFLQFIEGEEAAVKRLLVVLSQDSRHTNLKVLLDEPVNDRSLFSWSMGQFMLDESTEVSVAFLEMIRDGYKANLKLRTDDLISVFKGFLDGSEEIPVEQHSTTAALVK